MLVDVPVYRRMGESEGAEQGEEQSGGSHFGEAYLVEVNFCNGVMESLPVIGAVSIDVKGRKRYLSGTTT